MDEAREEPAAADGHWRSHHRSHVTVENPCADPASKLGVERLLLFVCVVGTRKGWHEKGTAAATAIAVASSELVTGD